MRGKERYRAPSRPNKGKSSSCLLSDIRSDYVVIYIEYLGSTIRGVADDEFSLVCAVCGVIEGPTSAWRNIGMITHEADPKVVQEVSQLDETCTCCDIHLGVDDIQQTSQREHSTKIGIA